MSSIQAIQHAQQVRRRLINPPNAVPDKPINLKKSQVHISIVPEPPKAPEKQVININEEGKIPTDLPGIISEIRRLRDHLNELSTTCQKMLVAMSHRGPRGFDIASAAAKHYGCDVLDIMAQGRDSRYVEARHLAMYLCRKLTTLSLVNIGKVFSDRDHSTVTASIDKIERLRREDIHIEASITMLTERLAK